MTRWHAQVLRNRTAVQKVGHIQSRAGIFSAVMGVVLLVLGWTFEEPNVRYFLVVLGVLFGGYSLFQFRGSREFSHN